jgi:hypothetical protein
MLQHRVRSDLVFGVCRKLISSKFIGWAAEMLRYLSGRFSAVTVDKDKMRLHDLSLHLRPTHVVVQWLGHNVNCL